MKVQILRVDWESAGPYTEATMCPMAMALRRAVGVPVSFSGQSYTNLETKRLHKVRDRFMKPEYDQAKIRYKCGADILFETETVN